MISIIVPVYNAESYLDECIQSIVKQTYKDWECILINDGSTDNSGDICDQWTKKDKRIKVIHQSNQGVSIARNTGINKANGEYLYFIDADDWCYKDTFQILLNENSDLIIGEYSVFVNNTHTFYKHTNVSYDNVPLAYLQEKVKCRIGSFIIKNQIIKNERLKFITSYKYGEDMDFILKCMLCATSISIMPKVCCCYRQHALSAMHHCSFERYSVFFSRDVLVQYSLNKQNNEVSAYLKNQSCIEAIITITRELIYNNYSTADILSYMKKHPIFYNYIKAASTNDKIDKYYREAAYSLLHNPYFFALRITYSKYKYIIRSYLGKIKKKITCNL